MGLGEAYIAKWWDCQQLDEFFVRILHSEKLLQKTKKTHWKIFLRNIENLQPAHRAFHIGKHHYDLGVTLYKEMLDSNMVYSCGYWLHAKNLEQAQQHKFKLICEKLHLKSGQKILEIGCGFGGFARYAAKHYDVKVDGITISKDQYRYACQHKKNNNIRYFFTDYRSLSEQEQYDHIVSIGMFEHVGVKNYTCYFKKAFRLLKPHGLFLLHTIGQDDTCSGIDPWIEKYIFPNGEIPKISDISTCLGNLFVVEDWHNFGADYDKTLMAWHKNFEESWPKIKKHYDERFYRMWRYYLLCCAGSFRARNHNQLWQIVLSKKGVPGGYISVR